MQKQTLLQKSIDNGLLYSDYLELIEKLHTEEKATSFQDNKDFYNYSKLGLTRMLRVFKKIKLLPELEQKVKDISTPQTWMLITESWCGDASQTVPIIARLAELNEHITLKVVLRDSNEELMEHYLTDGGKSIPILAVITADYTEIGRWGPRPTEAQAKVKAYKALEDPKPPYSELSQELQTWYNKDKGIATQEELSLMIDQLS